MKIVSINIGSQSRRWASQNQLDVITEASDESRPPSPGGDNRRSRNQGPAWNSSPGRLVRDNTSMPQRGLLGDVAVPGVDMMHHHSRGGGGLSNCRHPQGRMCENLKYGLQQMKYRGQKEAYKAVVEALVIGPEVVRSSEAEDVLGLSSELIHKTRARRGMSVEDDNDTNTSGLDYDPYEMMDNKRGRDAGGGRRGNRGASMSLRELFVHFARYGGGGGGGGGNEHGAGQHLSLTQSDKWLKQAGVIDNWNVTTTDTAIAFRKISRGSKYLDYETWKVFLEELAYRKRMDSQGIHEKLLAAGKPQPNQISVKTGTHIFRVYEPPTPPDVADQLLRHHLLL